MARLDYRIAHEFWDVFKLYYGETDYEFYKPACLWKN
jgi:hypothetical protein